MRAELSPYAVDPFGPSANPSAYVACEASERARAILERSLDQGRVGALLGPPGHGKTLLLRLLGGREEERGDDESAGLEFRARRLEELLVVLLLGVQEDDVEHVVDLRNRLLGVAFDQLGCGPS